ncbi:MAG: iron-sulfur cluster assembly protein [Planctomycetota bacterium]
MDSIRVFDSSGGGRPRVAPTETPNADTVEGRIIDAIKRVYDPEIPVNLYDLGLIYSIEVDGPHAEIRMTLTSPACPEAGTLPRLVRGAAETVDAIDSANVELVWEPAWTKSMMCDEAQLELGLL